MAYEGLDITLLGDTPISELYSKPIGKTVVLMTDEHARARPVLFDGPVLGGHHFLEARFRRGRLEIISAGIKSKDLGLATAEAVGLAPLLSGDRKAAVKVVGLFDSTGGRGGHTYQPGEMEYPLLLEKLSVAGLVEWAKKNPYCERERVPAPHYTGDPQAD